MALVLPVTSFSTGKSQPPVSAVISIGSGGTAIAGVTDKAVAASPSTAVLKKRFTIIPQVAQQCCPRQVVYPSSALPNRRQSWTALDRPPDTGGMAVQVRPLIFGRKSNLEQRTCPRQVVNPERPGRPGRRP